MDTHNKLADFAVHIVPEGETFQVYLQRHTPTDITFAMHHPRRCGDITEAEIYADTLADNHGGLAVVRH